MIYAELDALLAAVLGDDHATDTDWPVVLPAIISQAELRCYRDLDFLAVRKKATVTLLANVDLFAAPADWLLGQGIRLTATNEALDRREASFLDDYGGVGKPRYWAEPMQGTLQIAPMPSIDFPAELTYHFRPPAMSAANPSTWLGDNCSDLLLFACMVEATGYQRNYGAQSDDPKMALSWEQRYQAALVGARREEGRRKGDNAFDSSAAAPPSSNLPP